MTTEECQANLASAKLAYHQLMVGGRPRVVVDQNGQRVEFTAGNATRLYAYIQSLEAQCGCCVPAVIGTSGPAQFLF